MSPQDNSNKIFLVILAVSVLIVLFNFSRAVNISHELSEVRSDTYDKKVALDDYKNLEETSKNIAGALFSTFDSSNGQSSIESSNGYLFLKSNGHSTQFKFKRTSSNDTCGYRLLSENISDQRYGARLCSDLKVETGKFNQNNEAIVKVTSGSKTGYNIIKFTNETKNEVIHVIVFVK